MDFIEPVGTRYVEGKAYAAPQKPENYAKKQFTGSRDNTERTRPRKASEPPASRKEGEEEEDVGAKKKSYRSESRRKGGAISEKDVEIARLRGELEEVRRTRGAGSEMKSSNKQEQRARHEFASTSHTPAEHRTGKATSTRALETRGFKVVNGALVTDGASRRHREKRPEHSNTKGLGRTVDGNGLGVARRALVAEKKGVRASSRSRYTAKEPVYVEGTPRWHRRPKEDSEDNDETEGSSGEEEEEEDEDVRGEYRSRAARSAPNRNARRKSPIYEKEDLINERSTIIPSTRSSGRRSSRRFVSSSSTSSTSSPLTLPTSPSPPPTTLRSLASTTTTTPKSSLSHRPGRPSTSSELGSVIAPAPQIAAIRRRQRSRGRTLADAEIDMPAPETPSLRALSRRRRRQRRQEEAEEGEKGEEERAERRHEVGVGRGKLPVRSRSVVREAVRGEGRVLEVEEVGSVGFRPRREERRGRGGDGTEGKERGLVARRIEVGGRDRGGGGDAVKLVRREEGRTVYRLQ